MRVVLYNKLTTINPRRKGFKPVLAIPMNMHMIRASVRDAALNDGRFGIEN